ncbi:MAG: hypothetical protein KDA96_07210, partial [Planctomycetaceae bacterium]|nr:hypothetical protein [Planctomycetaceae bacterium]
MNEQSRQNRQGATEFPGFSPLTANYIYCPNQFFDVCLPNCSRGTVRLVAYLLRETLGWLDGDGNPQRQDIAISYCDLIRKAGVSRGAIQAALQDAVDGGFIVCRKEGIASAKGASAQTAMYSLRWDGRGDYIRHPGNFAGFFSGEGHRTPVPNQFFDEVVRNHPLSVTKVVGTVLRHTIGYQNQFGGRRSTAPLSQAYIARYSDLSTGKVVAEAIVAAEAAGFIARVEAGVFSPERRRQEATQYTMRWATGSKEPAENQSRIPSSTSSKKPVENQFKKTSTSKTKKKDSSKRQQNAAANQKTIDLLIQEGLSESTARKLIEKRGVEVVEQQVAWLDARNPENRAAMLQTAIAENWEKPRSIAERDRRKELRQRQKRADEEATIEDSALIASKQARARRKQSLLQVWKDASTQQRNAWIQAAVQNEASRMIADLI